MPIAAPIGFHAKWIRSGRGAIRIGCSAATAATASARADATSRAASRSPSQHGQPRAEG